MKFIIILSIFYSNFAFSKPITMDFTVTKITYNEERKYYETKFIMMAGIYKAEEKYLKCLQSSLRNKKEVEVSYEPMGLIISDCSE